MRKLVFCVWLLFVALSLSAVPADQIPITIVMSNGDTLLVIQKGDEYVSWFETDDGHIILPTDSATFEYATEALAASGRIVQNKAVRLPSDSQFLTTLNKNSMYQRLNEQRYLLIAQEDSIADVINRTL